MSRPGLIVGLGGTGQWVLTWLKRDLLLSNNGEIPSNIRLLSIDTATQLEAGASRVSANGLEEEASVVGGVSLAADEFVYIGGDALKLAEEVSRGKLQNIGSWFHADKWLTTQSPATFILDDGAGRLRQFGRLAVFKDILGRETGSKLWRALRTAIEGVRTNTDAHRRLEIIVVGSFAGGTGSGMFIDVALILRLLAQKLNVHHVLRGFFALPSVFTTNPDQMLKARSFAAFRELNRFMVVNAEYPMPEVEYVQNQPLFHFLPEKRIFDACYLVDGKRNGKPLAEESKYGAFPMMAESISAILDEKAGTAYTQWVFQNLMPEYARTPEMPMYSAIGAYSVQVPAHFVQQISSHLYAQKSLLQILSPQKKPQDGKWVFSGAKRQVVLSAPDQNREDRGFAGRTRSLNLFQGSVNYQGQLCKPTPFLARIAEIVDQSLIEQKRAQIISQIARSGGAKVRSAAAAVGWIAYFPEMGDDQQYQQVRNRLMAHMNYNIPRQYGRKEDEKESDARPRFRNIPEDLRKRFGGVNAVGKEDDDFDGECGDVLKECKTIQVRLFNQLVRLKLLEILNGTSEDAIASKSGKLGYAYDYFDGVVEHLDAFLKIMKDIKTERDKIKPELKYMGLSKKAKKFLEETAEKKIFWFWEHPKVKGAERAYLQAQQRMMELRREDLLHKYVESAGIELKNICLTVRDILERWIYQLSTGDDARQITGLWDSMQISLQEVKDAHSYDTKIDKVQQLVLDNDLPVSQEDISAFLKRWNWQVNISDAGTLSVSVQIEPSNPDEETMLLNDAGLEMTTHNRQKIGDKNQNTLLHLASEQFQGVIARAHIADAVKEEYKTPQKFVESIADISAEPLFEGSVEASPRKKSNYIRVDCRENDQYFTGENGIQGLLRALHQVDRNQVDEKYSIQVVGSENPYKLTLVRTDDLYDYDAFQFWHDGQKAYAAQMGLEGDPLDPVLLHNFAAEARAVDYERRMMRSGMDYQPLHPRVVMLLENPVALRYFVYLGMLGMISEAEDAGQYHWQLKWDRKRGEEILWLTKGWNADKDQKDRSKPNILNAVHGFVILQRNQAPNRHDVIDHDFAQRLIESKLKDIGLAGEKTLIESNLSTGFVSFLKQLGYDEDNPDHVVHKDIADLATIVEMILQERLEAINTQLDKKKNQSGPFNVYQGGEEDS